mgnify:CR=1 FL=1
MAAPIVWAHDICSVVLKGECFDVAYGCWKGIIMNCIKNLECSSIYLGVGDFLEGDVVFCFNIKEEGFKAVFGLGSKEVISLETKDSLDV